MLSIWPSLIFILSCTVPSSAFISSTVASSWFSSLFIRGSQRHPFMGAWKEWWWYIYLLHPTTLLAHLEHYHSLLQSVLGSHVLYLTLLTVPYSSSADGLLVDKAQRTQDWSDVYGHTLTQQCWFHWGYKQHWAQSLCAGWGNITSQAYTLCLNAVILNCKKKKPDFVDACGLYAFAFKRNSSHVLCPFSVLDGKASLLLFTLTLLAFSCPLPAGHSSACLWLVWHHLMAPLQGQLHWPHLNLSGRLVTQGSLKQGQLNLISFLCSPKAESGSFRSCASSPKQLLWTLSAEEPPSLL